LLYLKNTCIYLLGNIMHIKNQVVLVTGGARGLGLAITHALINEGARVVLV